MDLRKEKDLTQIHGRDSSYQQTLLQQEASPEQNLYFFSQLFSLNPPKHQSFRVIINLPPTKQENGIIYPSSLHLLIKQISQKQYKRLFVRMSEVNDNPEEEWQFLPPQQRQVYKAHVSSQLKEGKKARKITITDNKLSIMIDISPLETLEEIWLNRNNISSIECLWEMKMFNLKKLSLSHNQLISFSPIRYMACPNLDQLQLDHNLCDDEGKLGETKFNKNVMIWIAFTEENQMVQKKYLNKCINARFANIPIKMRD